jgi:hypothetical protein
MPGFLVHVGAVIQCAHGGLAQPTLPDPRVTVSGQPIVTQPAPYVVAGCAFPPPPVGNGPCVTANWVMASVRVMANGMPIVLADSQAICTPTATPLVVGVTQVRVKGM